ncbi:helix-turn-helix domain-containing protein [Lentzea albidocapillata]|uniref:Transcriptional regulator, contains XRE-family HTH domain n=1 Tax=Lentzea albidocapillata TaxID=40571 RepID=A0A1W2EGJ1_9PSEU|nr:helix-turn-helix transcriptional regulator [Lentzea albidocapillata]SMD08860.1 Transcriptional regulator, contains XRE-family HTH domain [Lentzea albidocapillata]
MGQARQTVERLQLGLTLQRLRLAAGKSQQEAADLIGRSAGRLSQVENGKGALGTEELTRLLGFYGVTPEQRDSVLALGKASRRRQPRLGYLDTLADSYVRFMDLLAAARHIGWYECGVIPGLVQSRGYVEGLIRASSSVRSEEETAELIAFRLDLQQQVLSSGKVKSIDIVFTEDSLLHVVGDQSVMREQVLHLLQLLEQHPSLNIRIVGLGTPGNPGLGGGMVTLDFDTSDPITFTSSLSGPPIYYDQPSHTERMRKLFERIADLAWSPRDTRTALADFLARSS